MLLIILVSWWSTSQVKFLVTDLLSISQFILLFSVLNISEKSFVNFYSKLIEK